jgi:hypothetical protein
MSLSPVSRLKERTAKIFRNVIEESMTFLNDVLGGCVNIFEGGSVFCSICMVCGSVRLLVYHISATRYLHLRLSLGVYWVNVFSTSGLDFHRFRNIVA